MVAQLGGKGQTNQPVAVTEDVDSTGATITLNLKKRRSLQIFVLSDAIAAVKTWALSNVHRAGGLFKVRFTVAAAGVGDAQTFPDDWKMSDANFTDSTHQWSPPEAGDYEMEGSYDTNEWAVKIFGPFNTN